VGFLIFYKAYFLKLYLLSGDKKNNAKNVKNSLSQRAEAKNAKVKPNNVLTLVRNLYYD